MGLQEARTPAGTRHDNGYFVIASGTEDGKNLGVELWVATALPYHASPGRQYRFHQKHCVVLKATPRLLIVRLDADMLACTFVVAHAPHSRASREARERWWSDLAHDLAVHGGDFLFIDANARVGSVHTTAVGGCGRAQLEDNNGSLFHEVLLQSNLAAPATLLDTDGEGYTWVEQSGGARSEHRIDYVIVPREWLPTVSLQAVLYDFDPIATHEDHSPVTLRCRAQASPRPALGPWRRSVIDRSKLKDADAVYGFAQEVSRLTL